MSLSKYAIGSSVRTVRNKSIIWSVVGHIDRRGEEPQVKLAVTSTKWGNPITMTVPESEVVAA